MCHASRVIAIEVVEHIMHRAAVEAPDFEPSSAWNRRMIVIKTMIWEMTRSYSIVLLRNNLSFEE